MRIIIQGIAERLKGIKSIRRSLNALPYTLHLDTKRENAYVALIDMLTEYPRDDYRLTIQDDAILCDNFSDCVPVLQDIMESKGIHVLSLYVPNHKKLTDKHLGGYSGLHKPAKSFFPCVCYILSPKIQEELLEYSKQGPKETKHDDDFIVEYCVKSKTEIFTILPSMVQHDIGVPSSLGHANTDRRTSRVFRPSFFTVESLTKILSK